MNSIVDVMCGAVFFDVDPTTQTTKRLQAVAMFSPPAPVMREYCERDENGTGPVLDEDEGEEVIFCPGSNLQNGTIVFF